MPKSQLATSTIKGFPFKTQTVTMSTDGYGNITLSSFLTSEKLLFGAYVDRSHNNGATVVFITTTATGAIYMLKVLNNDALPYANQSVKVVLVYIEK